MKTSLLFVCMLCSVTLMGQGVDGMSGLLDDHFYDRPLRIDYYRVGNRTWDTVELCRFVAGRGSWSGPLNRTLDPFDNGDYRVVVRDTLTGKVLFSKCYNTLFREYRDTREGWKNVARYEEVVTVPMPRQEVDICFQRRDTLGCFVTQSVIRFSPSDAVASPCEVSHIHKLQWKGDSHGKVDVVIVPEGYGTADSSKMRDDMGRFMEYIFAVEPFRSRRQDFNVWAVEVYGEESGITDPNRGMKVNSAVGASYNTFGADRYLMTFNLFRLYDLLDSVPCDHIVIMANSETYGGGAIYNFYAISSVCKEAFHVLPHELGHSIGGLADEYIDEDLSYGDMHHPTSEPVEPNITSLVDFGHKWASMIPDGTPIPTPADPNVPRYENGPLGCYEGAGYQVHGLYRPAMHCMMRDYAPFCAVCRKRLEEVIDFYVIDN